MKKSERIIERDSQVISPSLTRELPVVFDHGSDCSVWDADGKKYLDFTASVAVNSIGHANPEVRKAIEKQLKLGIHCCFSDFYAETPVRFVERLLRLMPPGFGKAFLSNSGTESTECAYKLARWHTNKRWVIAFEGAFHGRTMGSLSMTKSKPVQRERFGPFLAVMHSPYPYAYRMRMEPEECSSYCLGELEKKMAVVKNDLAAVFMEPVQGEGGYIVPPKSFVRGVRKLCDEYGVLLGDDEVQAGCFRTGPFLAIENFLVKPDIVWLSKAIGGGLPLGVTVAPSEMWDWPPGSHANTFGGNLLACAAGIASLDFMVKKRLGKNAVKVGGAMMKRLGRIMAQNDRTIMDVRGLGLMIGVETRDKETRERIIKESCARGLLLLPAGDASFRICPPLTLTTKQAMAGLDIIEDALEASERL